MIAPATSERGALRDFLRQLQTQDIDGLSDAQLLTLLQNGGLVAAPLLGRKVAVSGSAQEAYQQNADGGPLLGIGDAIAESMLLFGADVVVNSHRREMDSNRLEHLQKTYGRTCSYLQSDMSSEDGARAFVRGAAKALGGLDTLILNAGTYSEPAIEDISYSDAKRLFDLNVAGAMFAISEFVGNHGKTARKGRIVVTTSINASRSETRHALYDGSKGWLESFVRSVALDLAERGIDMRINAVAPGLHETPLTREGIHADPMAAKIIDALIPLGIGTAADVAMPYVFLASPANDYMTGAVIDASGGLGACQMMPDRLTQLIRDSNS